MYTLHAYFKDWLFPCIFALLTDKNEASYTKMIKIIADDIHDTTLQGWYPIELQIDFEQSMIQTLKKMYPYATVKGCFFHFAKAIHMKAEQLGLKPLVGTHDHLVRKIVKFTCALAFLPEDMVAAQFEFIRSLLNTSEPYGASVERFLKYTKETWIGTENRPARFPNAMWTQYHVFEVALTIKWKGGIITSTLVSKNTSTFTISLIPSRKCKWKMIPKYSH